MSILAHLPRFRDLDRVLRMYEDREQWSSADVAAFQLERVNRTWHNARNHVEYYRRLAQSHDLPETFESIAHYTRSMPLLSKELVRQHPEHFLADNRRRGSWHRTGGSTGTPTSIYWEHDAHLEMLRGKYRCEQSHGLSVFDPKLIFWGHAGSFSPGWRGVVQRAARPVEDRLRNRLRLSAYDVTDEQLRSQIPLARAFAPASLYGYSCAVHLLARATEPGDLPSLQVAILTAEPAGRAMLDEIEQRLDCRAVVEYGAVECGLMAYLMPDGKLHTRDDLVFLETVPNENGTYDIVVTVLGNASFPLMRYAIEDTTLMPKMTPQQGFGVLQEIEGRRNDLLIGKNGRRLHSMAVKHKLEHWQEIRRFTVKQNCRGGLKVIVEPQASAIVSQSLLAMLQSEIQEMLEGFPVEIETVACLPGNLAGKHRWIISELANKS